MRLINNVQTQILLAVARYKYLTVSQLMKIYVGTGNIPYLRKQLKALIDSKKPLIECSVFANFVPKKGRLENVYFLSKYGKRLLMEDLYMEEETIKIPIGKTTFTKDYFHRKNTIDFQIALYQWSEKSKFEVLFFDTYFDKTGNNRTDKNLRAKTKIDLPDNNYLIPDANFLLNTAEGYKLFLFEMYNGKDTKRVLDQLRKHAQCIELGSPSEKYNLEIGHGVVALFEFESIEKAVIDRLKNQSYYEDVKDYFLFKNLNNLAVDTFFRDWKNVKGELISFY